jgi:hypothetical protein
MLVYYLWAYRPSLWATALGLLPFGFYPWSTSTTLALVLPLIYYPWAFTLGFTSIGLDNPWATTPGLLQLVYYP